MITSLFQPLAVPLASPLVGELVYSPALELLLTMNLSKTDRFQPAFFNNFEIAASIPIVTSQAIAVALPSGTIKKIPASTPAPLDSGALIAGSDYAVHCLPDGSLITSADFTSPAGGMLIGGFHFSPGHVAHVEENAEIISGLLSGFGDGPNLKRSGNFQVSTGSFYYLSSGEMALKIDDNIDIDIDSPIPPGKWGSYRVGINGAGTLSVVGASGNVEGYTSEAAAYAGRPSMANQAIGTITIQANASGFTPGTDALTGGVGGNVAIATNYYSESATGPAINPYSIWDLNFRPTCEDPRGMALIAGQFWVDIYLTNTRPDIYGTSAYNKTIADGSSRASRPVSIGGKADGTLLMPSHSWWDSALLANAYGKALPTLDELQEATQGATQGVATTNDRVVTSYDASLTSRYGICQSFGVIWTWTQDAGDSGDKKALFGGSWDNGGSAGSRYVVWSSAAPHSYSDRGSRFRSDHLLA